MAEFPLNVPVRATISRRIKEGALQRRHRPVNGTLAPTRDACESVLGGTTKGDTRERERALNQTNLDARDARIAGAIEAAIVKLRSEFDVAGDKLRDEFNAATSKLHDEINTKLARLPLEVRTWEPVGEALDQIRQQEHELHATATALRDEFDSVTSKLHNEINTRLARLPLVKEFQPETVYYMGDVVVCDGSVYQAKRDTGRRATTEDWILLAARGCDGIDGRTPNLRGVFEAYQQYRQFDIVTCDGNCYIARHDDPGLPGHDDSAWQLLAKGSRGPSGDVGPRGRKGERGARGEAAPTIVSWDLDRARYTAVPTMSDGTQGAVLDLRGLFEQFQQEAL